jgi:hypothetical protein
MPNDYPNLRRIAGMYSGRAAVLQTLAIVALWVGGASTVISLFQWGYSSWRGQVPFSIGMVLVVLAGALSLSSIALAAVGELLTTAADTAKSTTALAERYARVHPED